MLDYSKNVKLKGHKLEVDLEYYSEEITMSVLNGMREVLKHLDYPSDDKYLVAIETVLEYMGYDFEETLEDDF